MGLCLNSLGISQVIEVPFRIYLIFYNKSPRGYSRLAPRGVPRSDLGGDQRMFKGVSWRALCNCSRRFSRESFRATGSHCSRRHLLLRAGCGKGEEGEEQCQARSKEPRVRACFAP